MMKSGGGDHKMALYPAMTHLKGHKTQSDGQNLLHPVVAIVVVAAASSSHRVNDKSDVSIHLYRMSL